MRVFKEDKGEQPMTLHKKFTLSFHEKSQLRPFVKSWIGESEDIDSLKKSGFYNPSQHTNAHAEMHVGAPSFTKDLNLGFNSSTFGGRNVENYLYTEIPYADYKFARINMTPDKYDNKEYIEKMEAQLDQMIRRQFPVEEDDVGDNIRER